MVDKVLDHSKEKWYHKLKAYDEGLSKDELPDIVPGDIVRVHVNIYEEAPGAAAGLKKIHRIAAKGKEKKEEKIERVQVFEGTVIRIHGKGLSRTVTVRKLSSGIGVEKTWFLHSRKVSKIEVLRHSRVRRSKLYYLRDRVGKATSLKERRREPKAQ
ncbi:MAG: 50S ribosomal protein L19 [bacterium]|jgi:ribosomal protein L19